MADHLFRGHPAQRRDRGFACTPYGCVPAWHDFIVWDGADVPSWVTIELLHARSRTADPDLVALYERL
jgi:hypothetical protein